MAESTSSETEKAAQAGGSTQASSGGPHELKPLPWKPDALEPVISERTMSFHYGKHHRGYVNKLNELINGTDLVGLTLEQIITRTADDPQRLKIYQNGAQVWNHDFFWRSLKPGGSQPQGELLQLIEKSFGSLEECKKQLADAAVTQFGTGWGWLVLDGERLRAIQTEDADNPLVLGMKPLLTIDVWEHAYYLDYQNERPRFVQAVIDRLLDWDFAAANLGAPLHS